MFKKSEEFLQEGIEAWTQLQGLLHPDVIHAPQLHWNAVEPRFIRFLYNEVREKPWLNHLALLLIVLTCHTRLDQHTIEGRLYNFNARWRTLFPKYHITSFEEWEPDMHFPLYFNDTEMSDSLSTRQGFLEKYAAAVHHLSSYIRSLPKDMQHTYQKLTLPPISPERYRAISRSNIDHIEQQQRRKAETDAFAPHFARLRGEAHLRWNQIKRLREKYCEAVSLIESGKEVLPLTFSYKEPGLGQHYHFRLWDRYSFFEQHAQQFSSQPAKEYRWKVRGYAPEKNHFFLEFLYAESLSDGAINLDSLLWFGDLLRYDILGCGPTRGTEEEVKRKQDYLRSWGYGDEENMEENQPFRTTLGGLLCWPKTQERFLREAQHRTQGIIFVIEPLYAAATFGLAALSFFTTTGARNGELVQISLDRDCLYTIQVEDMTRYLMRLVPKGRDKPADYIICEETRKNLERVADLLHELYQLQPGEHIPHVSFNPQNHRAHRFTQAKPYLFQYQGCHFPQLAVTACMRFLCHGLVFQTTEGKTVALKAHALRHVFATHIHQVEGIPLDIVAVMLHQKNVQVTAYYAAPPWQQVLTTANSLLDKFATKLGAIEEAFVRAPAELQHQLEEAKAQVGSLNKIPGGDCTCHAICPISFACTGCVYNVPNPDREEEIVEQEQWAFIRLDQVKKRGQGPEIVKMQALIQRCQVTRQEMQLIRTYRKDESYVPTITLERNEQGCEQAEAMVTQTLPRETPADDHAS